MTLTQEFAELRSRTETELNDVLRNAATIDEVDAAERALLALHDARLRNILADFNGATRAFVELTEGLQDVIDAVQAGSPRSGSLAALSGLLSAAGAVYAGLRAPERLASATTAGDVTVTLPVRDEHEAPPLNSRSFADLRDEYAAYFRAAAVRPERAGDLAFYLTRLRRHRARYEAVGDPLGIPWYFIGCIHALEGGFDFGTHLFNGDPLAARTVRVPRGQPAAPPEAGEGRPYTWEESARAAMRLKGFGGLTDWSLPRLLYRWEAYNGFGYRTQGVPTPYLWSFSTVYTSGRYVADHRFDRNAVSRQAGAATMLNALAAEVDLPLAA